MNESYIYIMTNNHKNVLYIGVTNDLIRRVYEHKNHEIKGSFTDKYNCENCVYYEKWNRKKKEDLINIKNPNWINLVNDTEIINIDEISNGID